MAAVYNGFRGRTCVPESVIDRRYRTGMSLLRFCEWLAATPGSIALHESRYLYLVVLSVHVLTLCLFVGTAAMIDLRLMGLTMQRVRFSEVIARLLPGPQRVFF